MAAKFFRRLEVLVSTGSPGLYRVMVFFFVQHVYSLSDLGKTAASLSGAQIASYVTAVGWTTLVLVRLPATATRREAINLFYRFIYMSFLTTSMVSALSVGIAISGLMQFEISGFLWQLWGWSAYQMGRHFFVANKEYRVTIALDMALIATTLFLLQAFHHFAWSSASALGLALSLIAFVMFALIGLPTEHLWLTPFEGKGLEFGLTNFLSGGIPLAIVPAAERLCGPSFTGVLSLLASSTAIGLLLPRAISLAQLPELARLKGSQQGIEGILCSMKRMIRASNLGTLVANLGIVAIIVIWKSGGGRESLVVAVTGLLLCIQNAVGVMGTVNSAVLMVFERSRETIRINCGSGLLFAVFYFTAFFRGGVFGFLIIMVGIVVSLGVRNKMLRDDARYTREAYRKIVCLVDLPH
jgi:hypothetical protein